MTLHLWRAEYGAVEWDAVKRLWQTEGLLMRQKRRKRGRTDTGEDGIVDRRATREVEMRGIDFVRGHTADGHPPPMLVVRDECTALTVGRETSFYRRRSSSRWRKRGCREAGG